jgi:hypothetical protein
MYSHKTIKAGPQVLYIFYKIWKEAVDEVSYVQDLYPTFVTNVHAPGASRVGKTNGVGNVWGLEAEPLICKYSSSLLRNARQRTTTSETNCS